MTALSDYLENQLIRWAMTNEALGGTTGGVALTRPTAWHVALFSTATSDSATGTEISGGGYARQAVTFTVSSGSNQCSNNAIIDFVSSADWPNITHIAIMTAATGGQMLFHGPLAAARDPASGDTIRFAAGAIVLSLD